MPMITNSTSAYVSVPSRSNNMPDLRENCEGIPKNLRDILKLLQRKRPAKEKDARW